MTPSELLQHRADLYRSHDAQGIFLLYSVKSDLRKFFMQADDYTSHLFSLVGGADHAGITIVKETLRGNLAEVTYVERFSECGQVVQYYSKAVFTRETDVWKILKDTKERVAGPVN